jgi:uncharacterized membrane protein
MLNTVRFVLLLLLALLVGSMFGIWVGFNPTGLSATAYVEQQQNAIRSFNTLLPAMGAACIVLGAWLAVAAKEPRIRWLLIAAVACLVAAGVVTRFCNQPINAVVITWSPQNPPPQWAHLRDAWWHWHIVRTVAAIAGLGLSLAALLWSSGMEPRNAA